MPRSVGRYELLRPLGRGGMAEVFHARRRGPGGIEKRLVVKRIRRERSADPRFVALFVQEARLSMSLAHKNIVPVFDFGRVGDELFLVMEYVDGPDLAAAIERGRDAGTPLDYELAAFVAMEACQALDYAHRARDETGQPRAIVHRDVTTRNVIVSASGEVKLVDFGVATSETEVGARKVRGTPAYMSPEQAHGDSVDPRSDVFSLGLVLYEAIADQRAYSATSNAELLEQARRAEVPALPTEVPDELRTIVERATATAPGDRFADARAMQLSLDSFLVKARAKSGGPPPSVRLAGWIESFWSGHEANGTGDPDEPAGPVVTFLDDGEKALTTLAAGDETMQSMAATLAESLPGVADSNHGGPASGNGGPSVTDNKRAGDETGVATSDRGANPARRRGAAWVLGGAAAIALAAAAGLLGARDASNDIPSADLPAVDTTAAAPPADVAGGPADGPGEPPGNQTPVLEASDAQENPGSRGATTTDEQRSAAADNAAADDGSSPPPRGTPAARRATPRKNTEAAANEPVAATATGVAAVAVRPWARVTVVGTGQRCAETPCRLELPAGQHSLRLEHTVWNVTKTVEIEIRPGQTTQVSEVILQPR